MTSEDLKLLAEATTWAYGEGWGDDSVDPFIITNIVKKARAEANKLEAKEACTYPKCQCHAECWGEDLMRLAQKRRKDEALGKQDSNPYE